MEENKKNKILIVDDELDILEFISYNLRNEGFVVNVANNGIEGISKAKNSIPDLVLLDVMMPRMDGMETCEELRKIRELDNTIIVFLTARGEDYSQIAGFDAGGDDYIVKPIKPKVLISRIKALIRRRDRANNSAEKQESMIIEQDDIILDREKYIVIKKGKKLSLPKKEFELLALLISSPERVFSRNEIFSKIWGDDVIVGDRTIDVHIRKLREKIGEKHIQTVKGVGYKYVS
ncbi:MAG: response regulator transcription factor [Bacteroidetes bacterium]|nr:response regulator transcription factor [Bacteroidota bacterium]